MSVGGLLPWGAVFDLRVLGGRFVSLGIRTNARIQSFTAECCYKCYSFWLSLVVVADGGDGSPTSQITGCGSTNDACWFVTSLCIFQVRVHRTT